MTAKIVGVFKKSWGADSSPEGPEVHIVLPENSVGEILLGFKSTTDMSTFPIDIYTADDVHVYSWLSGSSPRHVVAPFCWPTGKLKIVIGFPGHSSPHDLEFAYSVVVK